MPQKWGTVIHMSWLTLLGFDGEIPVLVANANLVTAFVYIYLGFAEKYEKGANWAAVFFFLSFSFSSSFDYLSGLVTGSAGSAGESFALES